MDLQGFLVHLCHRWFVHKNINERVGKSLFCRGFFSTVKTRLRKRLEKSATSPFRRAGLRREQAREGPGFTPRTQDQDCHLDSNWNIVHHQVRKNRRMQIQGLRPKGEALLRTTGDCITGAAPLDFSTVASTLHLLLETRANCGTVR